jgi:hypothetical protein
VAESTSVAAFAGAINRNVPIAASAIIFLMFMLTSLFDFRSDGDSIHSAPSDRTKNFFPAEPFSIVKLTGGVKRRLEGAERSGTTGTFLT